MTLRPYYRLRHETLIDLPSYPASRRLDSAERTSIPIDGILIGKGPVKANEHSLLAHAAQCVKAGK
jgi:hypothetical protein